MSEKTFREFLNELASDDYKKSSFCFDAIKKETEKSGTSISSCLNWIMQEGLLDKAQEVLKSKGEAFKKEHFFESSFNNYPFLKALEKDKNKASFIKILKDNNEEITAKDVCFPKNLLNHIIQEGHLEKVSNLLESFDQKLTREDIDDRKDNPRGGISIAVQSGRIEEIDNVLKKSGDGLTYNDVFVGYDIKKLNEEEKKQPIPSSPFELSINSTALESIIDFVSKKKWKIDISLLVSKDEQGKEYKNFLCNKLLCSNKATFALGVLEKNNKYLTIDDVIPDGVLEGSPLEMSVVHRNFKKFAEHLEKGGNPIKKEHLLKSGKQAYGNLLGHLIQNDMLDFAQDICKKEGKPPFTIKDLKPNSAVFFNLDKIFGIKGFSDKPEDMKNIWNKMPENFKTKEKQKIYEKYLKTSITNAISSFIVDKSR